MKGFRRAILLILLLSISVFAYIPRRIVTSTGMAFEKWADSSFPLTWRLNTTRGANITGSRSVEDAAKAAFASWAGVGTATVSFTEGAATTVTDAAFDGINLISVAPVTVMPTTMASLTTVYSFNQPGVDAFGRSILFPGQIVEADMVFNPNVQFSSDAAASSGRIDFESRMRHEIGHLLGLDHSALLSAAMYPTLEPGVIRALSMDDQIGVSLVYPSPAFWTSRGVIQGLVTTPGGGPVFGAHVVVMDAQGKATAGTLTGPDGRYQIPGLEPGSYQAYAEPLDGPVTAVDVPALAAAYPNQTVVNQFTTRFADAANASTAAVTMTKTAGDNQTALAGQALALQFEVEVRGTNNAVQPGVAVTFRATSGGGAVVPIEATTDAQGKARTKAYLGSGGNQNFTATASASTVTFTATAQPPTVASITFVDPASNAVTKELTVSEGNTIQASLRVLDSTGRERTDVPVTYTSLNPDIATVNSTGAIQGKKAGFSTLTIGAGGVLVNGTITVVQVTPTSIGAGAVGIARDSTDRIYLAAAQDHTILLLPERNQTPLVYAGVRGTPGRRDDLRVNALFKNPAFLTFNQADAALYVSDAGNNTIRRVRPGANGTVETVAGKETAGSADGSVQTATFSSPQGLALDSSGNLWVADSGNHTIRRIRLATGVVETVAGTPGQPGFADGSGNQAAFSSPLGLAIEAETLSQQLDRFQRGSPPAVSVLVADSGNGTIRRVRENGQVETIASFAANPLTVDSKGGAASGSPATDVRFTSPSAVASDNLGNIYVADPQANRISVILANGQVALAAPVNAVARPQGIVIGGQGLLLVAGADGVATSIRYGEPTITGVSPNPTSAADGDSITINGTNFSPESVVVIDNRVIPTMTVVNSQQITARLPALSSGTSTLSVQNRAGLAQFRLLVRPAPVSALSPGYITTFVGGGVFAGDGSLPRSAAVAGPSGVAVDAIGNVYISDVRNARVRRVSASTGVITTVAGNGLPGFSGDGGLAITAQLAGPWGTAVDKRGNIFIADSANDRVRKVASDTGIITTIATGLNIPLGIAIDPDGNVVIADTFGSRLVKVNASTGQSSTLAVSVSLPTGVAFDFLGNLYVANWGGNNVLKVAAGAGPTTRVAGNGAASSAGDGGPAVSASLTPMRIAVDGSGNLFVADDDHYCVRRIDAATGLISTVAGNGSSPLSAAIVDDVPATQASISPEGIAVDGVGNLYLGEFALNRVRRVDAKTGKISTFAGFGEERLFGDNEPAPFAHIEWPDALSVDSSNNIYIREYVRSVVVGKAGYRVRKVAAADGIITTLADATTLPGSATVVDVAGNRYTIESAQVIRIAAGTGQRTVVAGNGQTGSSGDGGPATSASLNSPAALVLDSSGNLYIAEQVRDGRVRVVKGPIP